MPRYFDHYEAMQEASKAGVRALLIKDHYYSATPVTEMLNKQFSHLKVTLLSGVPLNNTTGGLNLYAVEHGLKLGAKVVWMPTFSSKNHLDHHKKDEQFKDKFPQTKKVMIEPTPLVVTDGKGKLLPEVLPREHLPQGLGLGRGVLDEFNAFQAQGVGTFGNGFAVECGGHGGNLSSG